MTDTAPSKHTTKQEIPKSTRAICRACGLSGVSTMVKDHKCLNAAACKRRRSITEKREARIAEKHPNSQHTKAKGSSE